MYKLIRIVNTKAWIIDTAVSITVTSVRQNVTGNVFAIIGTKALLIISIIKWPAIKLAISRRVNVIGRIIKLISSIITRARISAVGLDLGTIWIIVFFILNLVIFASTDINIINDRASVKEGRTVIVNTYGIKPIRLITIKKKSGVIKNCDTKVDLVTSFDKALVINPIM